jgi:hypothetical protein
MNRKIRKGVFETNSSSTHSMCIAKNVKVELPDAVNFEFGEFGWEVDTLDSVDSKASYLYTGLYANDRHDDIEKVKSILEGKGVKVIMAKPDTTSNGGSNGYVDHSYEMGEFLGGVMSSENSLLSFLFSPLSFVLTGNDNDDIDVEISVNYPHDEYYKGN